MSTALSTIEITEKVSNIIRENATFTVDQIDEHSDLRTAYGIDSIVFVDVVGVLEEEFNIQFNSSMLLYENFSTVGKIVQILTEKLSA